MIETLSRATRAAHLWIPQYLWHRTVSRSRPRRAWLMIGDHFEPYWKQASPETAWNRLNAWLRDWPEIARRHCDSAGNPPRYCFFYPEDQYDPAMLDRLAELARAGIADVEVHIHHDGEGQQNFVDRMREFLENLRRKHGLLREVGGRAAFAFIHGNWALDNSHPSGRFCGLNNEITLLRDMGCYADFTLPCVPDPCQTGPVNAIYWATDDPARPRSHSTGQVVGRGSKASGDLLLVTGPLALNFVDRPLWKPRVETGELAANDRVRQERFALWLDHAPMIGDEVFIKLYTHGCPEVNLNALLQGDLDALFSGLKAECVHRGIELRYATAWEMRQAIDKAAA